MNKFNAKSCHCGIGHWHHSRFEAAYCNQLDLMVRAKEIQEFEIQVKYPMVINGKHICNYYADFLVTNNDGSTAVHETKGMVTDVYIIKKRLFSVCYPDIPFHEIRYSSKRLGSRGFGRRYKARRK